MGVNEFIKKHNIVIDENKVAVVARSANKPKQVVIENIFSALQKFNASEQLIKKVLQNTYTWYELLDEPEVQIKDFVNENGKLDESGLYYWLISD